MTSSTYLTVSFVKLKRDFVTGVPKKRRMHCLFCLESHYGCISSTAQGTARRRRRSASSSLAVRLCKAQRSTNRSLETSPTRRRKKMKVGSREITEFDGPGGALGGSSLQCQGVAELAIAGPVLATSGPARARGSRPLLARPRPTRGTD